MVARAPSALSESSRLHQEDFDSYIPSHQAPVLCPKASARSQVFPLFGRRSNFANAATSARQGLLPAPQDCPDQLDPQGSLALYDRKGHAVDAFKNEQGHVLDGGDW